MLRWKEGWGIKTLTCVHKLLWTQGHSKDALAFRRITALVVRHEMALHTSSVMTRRDKQDKCIRLRRGAMEASTYDLNIRSL